MVEHTPGKWVAFNDPAGHWVGLDSDATATTKIADVFSFDDARLIAAAPELLLALKDAVAVRLELGYQEHPVPRWVIRAQESIAKAEGRLTDQERVQHYRNDNNWT